MQVDLFSAAKEFFCGSSAGLCPSGKKLQIWEWCDHTGFLVETQACSWYMWAEIPSKTCEC